MQVIAKLNYLRIAPRKVRLAADLIRWKSIEEAQTILNFTNKKAASSLLKLLKQAISNAKNNFQLDPSNLYISKVLVDVADNEIVLKTDEELVPHREAIGALTGNNKK